MFGRLFGKDKGKQAGKGTSGQIQRLAPGLATTIFNVVGARSIPPMPGAAQKAFQLAVDPGAEARDFVDVIASDEALSARVLKIANSVYFDRGNHATTIDAAVTVIGLNELRCLLSANALSEIFPSKHQLRSMLWANDIATAIAARILAQRICPERQDLAFLGGLMHDVGKLLLLQRSAEEYGRVLKIVETEGCEYCMAEEQRYPFSHTEVGQLIGEQWHFSEDLLAIIRLHHGDWSSIGAPTNSLPALIKAADIIAHACGLGHHKALFRFRERAQQQLVEVWAILQVPEPEQKDLLTNIEKTFAAELELYSSQPRGNQ